MKKTIYLLLIVLAAAVSSCVYPFELETESAKQLLVIEGDIVPGQTCTFTLSYVTSLKDDMNEAPTRMPASAEVRVETESGKQYPSSGVVRNNNGIVFTVDLTGSDPGARYRLVAVNGDNGHTYRTPWAECAGSDLTVNGPYYQLVNNNTALDFCMDFSGVAGYFRIFSREDWVYRSLYEATCYYVPPEVHGWRVYGNGTIVQQKPGNHVCYSYRESNDIRVIETEGHVRQDVEGYVLRSMSRKDSHLSVVYRLTVSVRAISRDCYLYYDHLNSVTRFDGSLFSPNPSEMRGNLRCDEDPDELVIGFVDVAAVATVQKYFPRDEIPYMAGDSGDGDIAMYSPREDEWYSYYSRGYLPFSYDPRTKIGYWAFKRCVDCTLSGGTTKRPSDWTYDINDDDSGMHI